MTSLLTNVAAMTALQTLQQTNSMMDQTQNRISTGFRVGSASDNAAYWSIATTMRSDNKAMGAVEDSLGLGAAKIDIAYTGLQSAIEVVDEIKSKLVAAREPGVDKTKINSEIVELKKQLQSIASSASFSGENWLQNDAATAAGDKSVVGSFNRAADGSVTVGTIDITVSRMTLIGTDNETLGLLTKDFNAERLEPNAPATAGTARNYVLIDLGAEGTNGVTTSATGTEISIDNDTSDAFITDMYRVVDEIGKQMTAIASDIGAAKSRVEMQQTFVSKLMDSISKGISTLVDADMTEESTKLKALQTQQQLGVQALSIANNSSQSVLQLFQN